MSPHRRIFGPRWRLRPGSSVPAYAQIEDQLAARITAGDLPAGERLPPERELAKSLNVSRMTVRQALTSLADRGLVERGVGRGTFVARVKLDHDLRKVAGFSELMLRHGVEPGAKLISAAEADAPAAVAAALGVAPGTRAYRIQRLRYGAGVPLALEDSWIPAAPFPGLLELGLTGSLYDVMRDLYELGPVRAVERLEPVLARAHEAAALDVPESSPLMLVERTAYAADGTAVEFAHDRHRGDRARFTIETSADVPAHI
ncbi:MAG TPA: phosphonate metabolism transcriptional regulator PhnF [Thermoleophilaceae bacterium]